MVAAERMPSSQGMSSYSRQAVLERHHKARKTDQLSFVAIGFVAMLAVILTATLAG